MPEHFTILKLFSVIWLYAEVHFRMPGFFSRYFMREPEILADVPHRVDHGNELPVLILIKDAHKFPVSLEFVTVTFRDKITQSTIRLSPESPEIINTKFWHTLLMVKIPDDFSGTVKVNVQIGYSINKKHKVVFIDNYKLTEKKPFKVYLDPDPLPRDKNWYFGDLHVHTNFTDDQVEFGAPLDPTVQAAKRTGLDFLATTDHSYDLDDSEHSCLENDPALPKWNRLWQDIERINKQENKFRVIPGEELSAGNSKGQNVHFLILNNREFLYGSGDGAEKWFRYKPENTIEDVLKKLGKNVAAFAAHPEIAPPVSQKILINRGKWEQADYLHTGLSGLEILNGKKDKAFYDGIKEWVKLLLAGYKLSIVAGNDAHGNFGRFRQLKTPFVSMVEDHRELLGQARTGILINDKFNLDNIIKALKLGRSLLTDGPFATFEIHTKKNHFVLGDTFTEGHGVFRITAKTSRMFGELECIELFCGDYKTRTETQRYKFRAPLGSIEYTIEKFIADLPERGYVRLAVKTTNLDKSYLCLTNPIFIDQSKRNESF